MNICLTILLTLWIGIILLVQWANGDDDDNYPQ
jgi:hypothetical protein